MPWPSATVPTTAAVCQECDQRLDSGNGVEKTIAWLGNFLYACHSWQRASKRIGWPWKLLEGQKTTKMNGKRQHLFCDGSLLELIQERNHRVVTEIDAFSEDRLLHGDLEAEAAALLEKYRLDPVVLLKDGIVTERGEANIDVRHDPFRMIRDRSRPHYVKGVSVTFVIPFTGDPAILTRTPNTYTPCPPLGVVVGSEVRVTYEEIELDPQRVRNEFDKNLNSIRQYLSSARQQVDSFNQNLPGLIQGRVNQRKHKLLQDNQIVESMGFPLRQRADMPRAFAVPVQRKRVSIAQPSPVGKSRPGEPLLDLAAYETILETIASMARVMELSPKAFAAMDEEALRFMLLIPLNVHYEGQATGETFNWEGKTDIIIKVGGKNIFIAECLIWRGAEYFRTKIDQLLGYTSWRDTKTAMIVFNHTKNMSAVLRQIPDLVKAHPNFRQEVPDYKHETGSRFTLRQRDDPERDFTLTVLVFDVPTP